MERLFLHQLRQWRRHPRRKPLIVRGARQTGKTWIIREFGRRDFRRMHYLAFDRMPHADSLFEGGGEPRQILKGVSLLLGADIDPAHDLLVFDEIQECPAALASLKHFAEQMPRLCLCAAGSHIGLALGGASFPVGKVDILDLYPMSFEEFLMAVNPRAAALLRSFDETTTIAQAIHEVLWREVCIYFVTGGMPEAVQRYVARMDTPAAAFSEVRTVQRALIEGYRADFAKHAGKQNAHHISLIFDNIPQQMSAAVDDAVQRYRFRDVIAGRSKFAQFEGPIEWLVKTGLAYRVYPVNNAEIPLRAFRKHNLFKLYLFDIGLLGAMLDIPPAAIIMQDYGSYKGYLAECFVAQELKAAGERALYCWRGRTSEVEFLLVRRGGIVPVEVKSGARARSRSLEVFCRTYSPPLKIKITARNLDRRAHAYHNYPLYLAARV